MTRRELSKRFLHVVPDEKFIEDAHDVFEQAHPGAHQYLLIGSPPLHLIRRFEPECRELSSLLDQDVLKGLLHYDAVFVHYLNDAARVLVAASPPGVRWIWIGWGADYYHLIRRPLLLPMTAALVRELPGPSMHLKLLRQGFRAVASGKPSSWLRAAAQLRHVGVERPGESELLSRFMGFSPVLREEFDLISSEHTSLKASFFDWNYLVTGLDADAPMATGGDLLVGNSATAENNHLDLLESLSGALGDRQRIICPLSYGRKDYADRVEERGRVLFGDRFLALRRFQRQHEFQAVLLGCRVAAMNHIRQQALGTILLLLWRGTYVFLRPENPIVRALANLGIVTHPVAELPAFLSHGVPLRSQDELAEIRDRLSIRYGKDAILTRTMRMFARVSRGANAGS